jgi:hypothetical protein
MLALLRRHIAEHAESATDFLFARRVHVAQFLRGAANGLTPLRAQAFHVFIAADGALTLLRGHRVQLMQAIDEPLLLLLRQGIESLLATQRIFLVGEGLSLMALQPGSEVRSTQVSRRYGVGTAWRSGIRDAGTVHGARHG